MINVMKEYTSFTEKCLTNYMKLIFGNKYDKRINDSYLEAYVNVRYSNYLNEDSIKLSLQKKISKALDDVKDMLSSQDCDIDIVNKFRHFYGYVYSLDQLYLLETQKKTIADICNDRVRLLKIESNSFESDLNALLREDVKKRKTYLDSFDSDTFEIKYEKLTKNDIGVSISNNIKFPELYSDVAIKKVSEKDNIAEDLSIITFLQTGVRIINDIIQCDFDKLYYVYLPGSFFSKKSKLARVTSIIDDDFIQDRLRVVVDYSAFIRFKTYIMELMRDGFVFAIYLDKGFDYCSDNIEYLEAFDKILMEKGKYYYKDMINNVKIGNRIISIEEVK